MPMLTGRLLSATPLMLLLWAGRLAGVPAAAASVPLPSRPPPDCAMRWFNRTEGCRRIPTVHPLDRSRLDCNDPGQGRKLSICPPVIEKMQCTALIPDSGPFLLRPDPGRRRHVPPALPRLSHHAPVIFWQRLFI